MLLGRHGTPESRAEYARKIAEWEANGRRLPPKERKDAPDDGTVNELAAAFWRHAEQHYRDPDGLPTNELDEYKYSLRPLKHLYGHTAVKDFGPLSLKALVSRADQTKPESPFKRVYREARPGRAPWRPVFLPWYVHPGREQQWYEAQRAEILSRTGSLDDLHEQYPETDAEALAPRSLDKRIPLDWLKQCFEEWEPLARLPREAPSVPGLEVYSPPERGRYYALGVDPAEGNPTSDDSALVVADVATGEEVAALAGRLQPSVLAAYADAVGRWYNHAGVLVERNNHGHAVLLWLGDNSRLRLLCGHDGRLGWLSSGKGNALLYSGCADALRHREAVLHSFATFLQLSSVDGSTLRAPEGQQDDRAVAFALACAASSEVRRMLLASSCEPVVTGGFRRH